MAAGSSSRKTLTTAGISLALLASVASGFSAYSGGQLAAAPAAKKVAPAAGKCNPRAGSGTLEIRFQEDLPAEAAGISVSVVGPNRFRRTGLAPGRNYIYQRIRTGKYTVTITGAAARRFVSHETVDTAFSLGADPNPACLEKNATARITIGYVPEPGSGKMWVSAGGYPYQTFSITRDDLQTPGSPTPMVRLNRVSNGPKSGAFDREGNYWLVIAGGGIERYPRASLGRSSDARPDIVLSGHSIEYGSYIAFDAEGGLWYSNRQTGQIVRFGPEQLTASGQPTPQIIISGLTSPQGLAFDAAGNLWAIDDIAAHQHRIVRYNASRLGSSYSGQPDASIVGFELTGIVPNQVRSILPGPADLAFDREGNLWVAYWNAHRIVKFNNAQQEEGGEQVAAIILRVSGDRIMQSIGFDNEGGLWVAGPPSTPKIRHFRPEQLISTPPGGDAAPSETFTPGESDRGAEALLFNPSPSWSPLNDR